MQRKTLVAALAALAAGTAAAQQPTVTIYGRLNASLERVKDGDNTTTQVVNNASRIGFKGTEDLGGGLKAGFQLEHGFSVDTGTQTQTAFWARQSELFVGSNWGTLRLGNYTSEAYYATADYISMHNHDTGNSSDAFYAYVGRNTNKIGYYSPDFGGLTFAASVSLKETKAPGADDNYDLAVNWSSGPLGIGAGYEKAGDANQFAIRGSYEMGPLVLGAYIQRDEDGYGAGLGKRTTLRLAAMYTMGLSELHVNVGRAGDYSKVDDSAATQFTLGYNYNLSKRTKVFAFYTGVNNKDNAPYFVSNPGDNFSSLAVGVRHNF